MVILETDTIAMSFNVTLLLHILRFYSLRIRRLALFRLIVITVEISQLAVQYLACISFKENVFFCFQQNDLITDVMLERKNL